MAMASQPAEGSDAEDTKLILGRAASPPAPANGTHAKRGGSLLAAVYCILYLLIGPTLIVVNRNILKELHFDYPMCLSGLGLLFTSIVCVSAVGLGAVNLEHSQRVTLRFACFNLMPVGAAMASTLGFGNAVYLYLPVGYIQMLKAFTPVVTLVLLCLSGIEVPSQRVALSVVGICAGTAIASLGEGSVTVVGLSIMLAAEMSEAVRLVLAQKLLKNLKMGVIEGQFWMAPISVAWLFGGAALLELPRMREANAFAIVAANPWHFSLSASLGLCVNMAAFLVIKSTSSVMLKVLGTARNAGLVVFGALVLGERVTALEAFGYGCSLVAFTAYNYYRVS